MTSPMLQSSLVLPWYVYIYNIQVYCALWLWAKGYITKEP